MSFSEIIQGKVLSWDLIPLIPVNGLCLIGGGTGAGKSCIAYGILEYEHTRSPKRDIYIYGYPEDKKKVLPAWIHPVDSLEFPEDSVVLIDEAYIQFHSRTSMSEKSKFIDLFTGLVRQKNILGIFISQTFRKLEIGILTSAQLVIIKKPPMLQVKMDRSEIRTILAEALQGFKEAAKEGYNPKECAYVISNEKDYMGFIKGSNYPPSFWSDDLSRAWAGVSLQEVLKKEKKNGR